MDTAPAAPIETVSVQAKRDPPSHSHFWSGNSFSFHDVLDAINPLQHLPLIGMLYRHFTGDTIGNVAEVVGDGLYGGVIGAASGLINVAVKEATGKDIGENLIALVTGHDETAPPAAPEAPAAPSPSSEPAVAAASDEATPAAAPADDGHPKTASVAPVHRGFMAIDTSARGILNMRAVAATHNPQPVALTLPPGTNLTQPAAPVDFAAKMREGLDKYQAMIASQTRAPAVDQMH